MKVLRKFKCVRDSRLSRGHYNDLIFIGFCQNNSFHTGQNNFRKDVQRWKTKRKRESIIPHRFLPTTPLLPLRNAPESAYSGPKVRTRQKSLKETTISHCRMTRTVSSECKKVAQLVLLCNLFITLKTRRTALPCCPLNTQPRRNTSLHIPPYRKV